MPPKDDEDFDEADKVFVDSLTPDGTMATGLVAIVTIMETSGAERTIIYHRGHHTYSGLVGTLKMAAHRLLDQWAAQGDDDDE